MENTNKNANEKYEQWADNVIGFAMVTGFLSLCMTIALAVVTHLGIATLYSAMVFFASIGIGKLGTIAFHYYTYRFECMVVVDETENEEEVK